MGETAAVSDPAVELCWLRSPADGDPELRDALVGCWERVSNAGGAVAFPFLPVDEAAVRQAVEELLTSLGEHQRLLVALVDGALAGWLVLSRSDSALVRHWGTVTRVQSDLPYRGRGIGVALMQEAARAARDDLGLEQLHVEVRGGQGLEAFYERLGWREVGRWPGALRLSARDSRDEVLMVLPLAPDVSR